MARHRGRQASAYDNGARATASKDGAAFRIARSAP